jgi:nitrite reductase (NO-forming)/hydroxylamine reductase
VVQTITVGGHSHFPEYTARGDFLYVSAGYGGDALAIYRSADLAKVTSFSLEVPAGIFSHLRSRTVAVGLEPAPR